MLRIALKVLLAVSLLVQGSVGVFAADAARTHARCHGMQQQMHASHGAPMKAPCCPPDCDMSGGMAACAACGAALMIAPEFVVAWSQPAAATNHDSEVFFAAGHALPPMRPPIA